MATGGLHSQRLLILLSLAFPSHAVDSVPQRYALGDRVAVIFDDTVYLGTVNAMTTGLIYTVHFDDGDILDDLSEEELIKLLDPDQLDGDGCPPHIDTAEDGSLGCWCSRCGVAVQVPKPSAPKHEKASKRRLIAKLQKWHGDGRCDVAAANTAEPAAEPGADNVEPATDGAAKHTADGAKHEAGAAAPASGTINPDHPRLDADNCPLDHKTYDDGSLECACSRCGVAVQVPKPSAPKHEKASKRRLIAKLQKWHGDGRCDVAAANTVEPGDPDDAATDPGPEYELEPAEAEDDIFDNVHDPV
jgi:hypothetical protein